MKQIFITGATGFVGAHLVHRLLEQDNIHLNLLVRGSEKKSANDRILDLLKNKTDMERITVYDGDVSKENFGLDQIVWNELTTKINTIYHSAASIHFLLPLEKAREINVQGTETVLKLGNACQENGVLELLCHISTAYVCGKIPHFKETDLEMNQSFNNNYEKSKLEAEVLVNEAIQKGLPAIIFRPSIISGNSKTGEITENSITFELMTQLSVYRLEDFLGNETSSLNIISVDYLVNSLLYISENHDNLGKTFNITNNSNINLRQMLEIFSSLLNIKCPELIPFDKQTTASRKSQLVLRPFLGYYEIGHTFDNSQARQALEASDICNPSIDYDFFSRIVAFCRERNFSF
jgi:thioester reductase-like protein